MYLSQNLEILFLIQYLYTDTEHTTKLEVTKSSDEINEIILSLHTHYESTWHTHHLNIEKRK